MNFDVILNPLTYLRVNGFFVISMNICFNIFISKLFIYMAKRKYYKRKNNYKNDEVNAITWAIVFLCLWIYLIFTKYIEPNLDIITFYWKIIWWIIFIVIIALIFKAIKRRIEIKKQEKVELEKLPERLRNLQEKIIKFIPLRNYSKEEPYQLELAWFLKNNYETLNIEVSKNYTRPDIVIDDIAIEIKGPTTMNELKTIPDKIIRYLKHWDVLYIVLFNVNIVDDPEKNKVIFEEWKQDIYETFESKKDRIFIIEKY